MSRLPIVMLNESTLWAKEVALRQPCLPVNVDDPAHLEFAQNVISEMFRTLYSDPSSVALAAPQVGFLLQITTIDYQERDTNERKLLVLINPKIINYSDEKLDDQEICLSVPNFMGHINRAKSVDVEAYDQNGQPIKIHADDFFARVLQHEIDHLSGILYIDKIHGELEVVPDFPERRQAPTVKKLGLSK